MKRESVTIIAVLVLILCGSALYAHHGWAWATDEEFTITGTIVSYKLGNPHGEVTIDVDGSQWTVEIGQPWRNERAGLTEEVLQDGAEMTVYGHRSSDKDVLTVKAERLVIDGKEFDLYPNRES